MGIFESIKSAFGGKGEAEPEAVVGPSQMLRDAGLDPSRLKFSFGPGSITVSGELSDEGDRQKVLDVLAGTPGITSVNDSMTVAPAAPDTPTEAPEVSSPEVSAPEVEQTGSDTAAEGGDEPRTYTVQSGDTLWKISQEMYGDGSKYMKIFEANTDLLKDPDHIFPGQKLVIPV